MGISVAVDEPHPDRASPYLLSARAGAVLTGILGEIRALYVVGLNAQLAAGRADLGRNGFECISTRLYSLAQEIAAAIQQANTLSVQVSRAIHHEKMAEAACRSLLAASGMGRESAGRRECQRLQEEARQEVQALGACLRQLADHIEGAEHLAVNARVEASRVQLRGGGGDFEEVATRIRESIHRIRVALDTVRPDLKALHQLERGAAEPA